MGVKTMKAALLIAATSLPFAVSFPDDFFPLQTANEVTSNHSDSDDAEDDSAGEPLQDNVNSSSLASTCEMECQNSGFCVLDDDGIQHCSCPKEFSGSLCEHRVESCGSNFCHHGSECLVIELADGASEHICDCTKAYTATTYYSGEFCQYPSTQICIDPEDHGRPRQFCVNGGSCPSQNHLPCICPAGFSGPRCAFQMGIDGMDYAECDLPCNNGGTCHQGLKPSELGMQDIDLFLTEEDQRRHVNYEHCVCPPGFYGIRCDYPVQRCEKGQHLCFHGSICVEDAESFGCDCTSAELKTAGLFCEHIASSECDQWKDLGNGHRGFCTNGGKCDVDSDGSPKCFCPSGFEGLHCEFRMALSPANSGALASDKKNSLGVFGIIGISISAIAAAGGIVALFRFHPHTVRQEKSSQAVESTRAFKDHESREFSNEAKVSTGSNPAVTQLSSVALI